MLFQMVHRSVTDAKPLRIRCGHCGHQVVWKRAEAIRRCRPEATPMDLHGKLKCTQCERREAEVSI